MIKHAQITRGNDLSEEDSFDDIDPVQLLEAAAAAEQAGDKATAARHYNTVGNVYISVADYEEALTNFQRALSLYRELNDETGISDSTYNLGVAQVNLERWAEAAATLQTAVEIFQKAGKEDGVADALYGLALAKLGLGAFDEAMEILKSAQKVYKAAGNEQGVASTIMDIGTAYADKEDWENAEKAFKRALAIYQELQDNAGIADALSFLGDIAETQDNQKKAAELFVEAAQYYVKAKIFDIAREVIERAEAKIWDIPKSTRRRLRPMIDEVIDALPEEPETESDIEDADFDESLLDFEGTEEDLGPPEDELKDDSESESN